MRNQRLPFHFITRYIFLTFIFLQNIWVVLVRQSLKSPCWEVQGVIWKEKRKNHFPDHLAFALENSEARWNDYSDRTIENISFQYSLKYFIFWVTLAPGHFMLASGSFQSYIQFNISAFVFPFSLAMLKQWIILSINYSWNVYLCTEFVLSCCLNNWLEQWQLLTAFPYEFGLFPVLFWAAEA